MSVCINVKELIIFMTSIQAAKHTDIEKNAP